MAENWVYNLDLLAKNGVLNYDAASFIKGQPPRYVGNPSNNVPFAEIPETPLISQPKTDEFQKEIKDDKENGLVKLPMWKKVLFGLLLASGLTFGGIKLIKKIKGKVSP